MGEVKTIGILGSTGSIGSQALDIIKKRDEAYAVSFLTCNKRVDLLAEQIIEFKPEAVAVGDEASKKDLKERLEAKSHKNIPEIFVGRGGLLEVASMRCDLLLNALVGIAGLEPTMAAIAAGSDIALANKESLVAGGGLVKRELADRGVKLIPVDSEHSAIYQCLKGSDRAEVRKIILTGSGGPFRGKKKTDLESVSLDQALAHPNWSMGKKITIDSATLMNKGLEVIEAAWLFDLSPEEIEVVIHPQSIIHSMVNYRDGAVIAQLGLPDMRQPIAYAIGGEERESFGGRELDFMSLDGGLTFEKPDLETFSCLALAMEANEKGGSYPVVLNAANEVLVYSFLEGEISFLNIQELVEDVLSEHSKEPVDCLEAVLQIDAESREKTRRKIEKIRG